MYVVLCFLRTGYFTKVLLSVWSDWVSTPTNSHFLLGWLFPWRTMVIWSQPHFGVLVPCEEADKTGWADAYGYSQFYTPVSLLHFLDLIVERNCPWFAFPVMKLFSNAIPFNKRVPRPAAEGCRYGISLFPSSFGSSSSDEGFTDEAPKLRAVTVGFWAG